MTVDSEKANVCPKCGADLPEDSGHCPACLLENAIPASNDLTSDQTTNSLDVQNAPISEKTGDTIGDYKLLEKIGEGGFGVVYMAKQEKPVRRKVALKIIKLGMDTRQVVGRFEAERQALAMMDHPNIAKVLDAGSTKTGRPFFVMELVHGIPITEFCDENRFDTRQRIELCVRVCHAVQHAHQKGIIHRDLKPSNVLVTMHDDVAVPKIIDFGIAKATEHELTEVTLFTQFRHFLGTPAYMSPEQAQMTGLGVDTRSDIYSLGVLLYELLTGVTPLDLHGALKSGYDEIRRCIREEEPSRPSARLSLLTEKESTTLSNRRRSPVSRLQSQLKGDLDWIVMKAMEKDRTRRYETANSMAEDLEAYLNDEPVSAVAPSAWYLLTKLARRHKPVFASLAIVLPILILTTAISVSMFLSERKTRKNYQRLSQTSQQQLEELRERDEAQLHVDYARDIRAADRLVREESYFHAKSILERHIPDENSESEDLRGFAWYYLSEQINQRAPKRLNLGKGLRSERLVYSPDGRFLAATTDDGRIVLWGIEREKVMYEAHLQNTTGEDVAWNLDFSGDGRFLAACEVPDGRPVDAAQLRIQIWEVGESGMHHLRNLFYSPQPHARTLGWYVSNAVRFVPGTNVLAYNVVTENAAESFHGIAFIDVEKPGEVAVLPEAGSLLAISPDGVYLFSMTSQDNVFNYILWERSSGKRIKEESGSEELLYSFWDNESVLVASRYRDGDLELKEIPSLKTMEAPGFPWKSLSYVQHATRGSYVALKRARECIIWDKTKDESVFELQTSSVGMSPVLSHDGSNVARRTVFENGEWGVEVFSTEEAGESVIRNLDSFRPYASVARDEVIVKTVGQPHHRRYRSPRMDASSLLEAAGDFIGLVGDDEYWMFDTGESGRGPYRVYRTSAVFQKNEFQSEERPVKAFDLLDNRILFWFRGLKGLEIRSRDNLEVLGEVRSSTNKGFLFPFPAPELDRMLVVHTGGVDIVDITTCETIETAPLSSLKIVGVDYVSVEQAFYVAYENGLVEQISANDLDSRRSIQFQTSFKDADFSDDGKTLAVAFPFADPGISLYSLDSQEFLISLDHTEYFEGDYEFSPGSEAIVRANPSRTKMIWWAAPRP